MIVGRQSTYTPEMADLICDRIAQGESLRVICMDNTMPGERTVYDWIEENDDFRSKYARARGVMVEAVLDDMAAIEAKVLSGELDPAAVRVALDSKRWRAEKIMPKKYGTKITQEITGKDGGAIQQTNLTADEFRQIAKEVTQEF